MPKPNRPHSSENTRLKITDSAMIAGTATARLLRGRFDRRYRPAMLLASAVAALILIVRGLA